MYPGGDPSRDGIARNSPGPEGSKDTALYRVREGSSHAWGVQGRYRAGVRARMVEG